MVEENPNNEKDKKSSEVYETAENLENEITLEDKSSNNGDKSPFVSDDKVENIEKEKSIVKHTISPPPPPPPMQAPSIKNNAKSALSTKFAKKNNKPKEGEKISGLYDDNFAAALNLPPYLLKTEYIAMIIFFAMVIGIVIGLVVFSGNSCPPCTEKSFGVVKNPEITGKMKRCGIAEVWEPCRLLITNSSREEKKVKELYKRASTLSMVHEYKIDSTNIRYANDIIKPGYIAEIKIPPLN